MKSVRVPARAGASLAALVLFASCSGDGPSAPQQKGPPPPPPPPVATFVRYAITPDAQTYRLGEEFRVRLVRVMSDSTRVPVLTSLDLLGDPTAPLVIFQTNDAILALHPYTGIAVAIAPGGAVVEARIDNVTLARAEITVTPPNGVVSGALVVHDFWMVEFQYPTAPDHWFYAPQMTLSAAPGRTVTLLTVRFSVPGLHGSVSWSCGGSLGAESRLLNGEVYGDWTFTMDSPGYRASNDVPTATVTFVDDTGATGSATLNGTVVQGTLPTTYSGGRNGGPCFHGYAG